MTNNTINVPRELLENIVLCYNEGELELCTLAAECHALLSVPSSAGVDGLKRYEVFPYMDDDVAELDICESDDGSFVKYEDAQAIIDGLRGENERIRLNIAEYNEAIACYQSERDQQAQRIGELEQILRDLVPGCKWRFMRPRIDAALSAGKDSAS